MLALIAGAGDLPRAVARAQDVPPVVAALEGFPPEGLEPDLTFRLETLGSLLSRLRALGVTRLSLCGSIRRPQIDPARIDAATLPLVPRFRKALDLGDDGALRIVMEILEDAGFSILAAHEAAPGLLMPAGTPTRARPGPDHVRNAELGQRALVEMGRADRGQACVVAGGEVIGREDAAGTDAMLARLARARGTDPVGPGGILFKAPKPQQDRRADLPVIGPSTVEGAVAAGLEGIVIEAGGVMVLDQSEVIARCDDAGLFLWVRG